MGALSSKSSGGKVTERWANAVCQAIHPFDPSRKDCYYQVAGWSSPVARWAHNPKVVGSNPTPATKSFNRLQDLIAPGKSPLSPDRNGCNLL